MIASEEGWNFEKHARLGPTNPALHFSYYLVVNIFCLSNCNQPQETNLLSINTTNKLKYETELSLGCQRQPAASKNHSEQKILRKLQLYYLDYDKNVLENKQRYTVILYDLSRLLVMHAKFFFVFWDLLQKVKVKKTTTYSNSKTTITDPSCSKGG